MHLTNQWIVYLCLGVTIQANPFPNPLRRPPGAPVTTATEANVPTNPTGTQSASSGSTSVPASSGGGGGSESLPGNCNRINGIGVGFQAETSPSALQQSFGSLGLNPSEPPCTFGQYFNADASSCTVDGTSYASQAESAGSIYVASVKPLVAFNQVNTQAVADAMNQLAQGSGQVWVRLAWEMNWYTQQKVYSGDGPSFITMWNAVASKVDKSKVKMFWSPNPPSSVGQSAAQAVQEWYPGDDTVDIVGVDAYGQGTNPSFGDSVNGLCTSGSLAQKPFYIGEAGWLGGGTTAQKQQWWNAITASSTKTTCPNYLGFMWFEFNKAGSGDANGDYDILS